MTVLEPPNTWHDFTHRDYRPDHQPDPTVRGIPYDPFRSPSALARQLIKVASKSKGKGGKGVKVAHGRK